MSFRFSARRLAVLALVLPLVAMARPLPTPSFAYFGCALPPAHTVLAPKGLIIPLAMHTLADSSLTVGGLKFFRVSEEVFFNDARLFGAGAMACGRIVGLEKDARGRLQAIHLELVRVQATDGSQVALCPTLLHIQTPAANAAGTRVHLDAEVGGVVRTGAWIGL